MWWQWIFGALMKWLNPESIINGAINAYMKAKDVDLEKFKSSEAGTVQLGAAILDANIKFAQIKASYSLAILNWWPFRVILFALLFFPSMHFVLHVLDSMCPVSWARHLVKGKSVGGCGWGIPDIEPNLFDIYKQLLLFFILAKPVDTAIAGGFSALSSYLNRSR
jgi:hypothetical protein